MTALVSRRALMVFPFVAAGGWARRACAQLPVGTESVSSAELAERIDHVYGKMRTLKVAFKQVYFDAAPVLGSVLCEKPGKMSFRYENGNRIVSDGNVIRIYEKRAAQTYELPLTESQAPAALAFFGEAGTLQHAFSLSYLGSSIERHVLVAQPRKATPAYERIAMYVDRATYQVHRVLMIDAQGNRSRVDFSRMEANAPIPPREFAFTPPRTPTVVLRAARPA